MHEKYRGHDQIYTAANGVGMEISRIGNSIINTQHKNLVLKDIMHVHDASKSLLSVHALLLIIMSS